MVYLKVSEAAEKWNMSKRRVQDLCRLGLISGARRWGRDWMIPADAVRPPDGRSKAAKAIKKETAGHVSLLRKSPFLLMTNLYTEPGTADKAAEALSKHPKTQGLFKAEIAYCRGEIDEVYRHAREFLADNSGFYAVMAGGMLLGQVAMWKGDIKLWNEAHRHFFDAPCKTEVDRDIIDLAIASTDCSIRDTAKFPDWFARGCFDNLPPDSYPTARVHFVNHLLIFAQNHAVDTTKSKDADRMIAMKMLPYAIEPMITQMVVDKIVMAEIYLRILAATVYHQIGDDPRGSVHLDKAIRLCLADGFYSPLVENRPQLGLFLDDRLAIIDPQALKKVKNLYKQYHAGWTKLHNAVLDRVAQESLTVREREVSRLAAFGMTDTQIAAQLHLSESSVKAAIKTAKNKTGVNSRKELANFI